MKTLVVAAGVIVLVVGIALIATARLAISPPPIISTFSQPHLGEYVSAEILLNASSAVAVTSPATDGGMVLAQDVGAVNSTSISSYAVPYNSNAGGTQVYKALSGDYYYVAFSSAQPSTHIAVVQPSAVAVGRLPAIAGLGCIVAGIVVTIAGSRLNDNLKP